MAGLCAATVVVEARERSGALITADFALEEGREVLAVPGEITSTLSAGSNGLLRLGATPLTCAQDVLEGYGLVVVVGGLGRPRRDGCCRPRAVRAGPAGADELARATGLSAGELAVVLTELELAGLVNEEDGVYRAAS